ncbi:hypothetical protein [Janibacter sp. LM]|uniref:alpha/beta hydrolase n=1 Tax=Janibacter sp. LM TaxID=3144845 RepID=UPI0031F62C6C
MSSPPHEHVLVPGTNNGSAPLVLLHGSDGDEFDLLELAHRLSPTATKLGVRGRVVTPGGHAFSRRHADRRIDEEDLAARTPVLRDFILGMGRDIGDRPVVVGFSNGAIMAAAMLMSHPDLLAGAVLDMHAAVTHEVLPVGHAITAQDTSIARVWLQETFPDRDVPF